LALADPAKSSALLKAYETIIQQQIIFAIRREKILHPDQDQGEWENAALRRGWQRGLEVLQLISANARYYADAPTKMILDISSGNSMAGIIVDFMGQQQCAVDRKRSGHSRLRFILPRNGSAVSPDPIAILRGAPNESVAKLFLEFVLGEEGQKIVAFSVGSPGGPVRSELFRPAIHRRIYDASYAPYRSSVSDPYVELANFDYFPEYTAHHYNSLKWLIKFSCLIPHGELAAAWKAIIDARAEGRIADADAAQGILGNFSQLGYDEVRRTLEPILHQTNPGQALRLQRQLVQRFQCQYDAAREMARHGPGK
jgi:hypothetical protein